MTNPIFVDVDGQGYTPPKGTSPPFCPKACDGDDACPKEGEVCHDNADVGIPGDGGTCGPEIFGNCGLNDVLVEPKEEGALTVAPAEGHDPLARLRDRQQPDFHQRELRRAIRNHLLNGFAHPIHAHREAEH